MIEKQYIHAFASMLNIYRIAMVHLVPNYREDPLGLQQGPQRSLEHMLRTSVLP